MSKSGYQSKNARSQYFSHTIKTPNNILSSHQEKQKNMNEDIDSDFYEDLNPSQSSNIFRQSTERSYDEKGKYNSRKNHVTKVSKDIKKENKRVSKNSNIKNEAERQKALYSSPDFKSGSPYESPLFLNDKKNSKNFEERRYKTNYVFESKKINGKNVGTYSTSEKYEYINKNGKKESKYEKSSLGSPSAIDIISPVGYIENNSSGSDIDENQIKSFDNYHYSINTNKTNYTKYSKYQKNEKNKYKLNYELEEPEGFDYLSKNRKISNDGIQKQTSIRMTNRSQIRNKSDDSYTYTSEIKDFQSPERQLNVSKKFRKVNMGMINSKGPSNNDGKVTNIIKKEVIQTTQKKVSEKKENYYYSNDPTIRTMAAKIIQSWWRRKNYREEEIYDITVKSAIKLQSFIRGFLVRKKVLRYITLAIYYQSFCDKLQDILCNYVKKIIFKLFKDKFLSKKTKKTVKKNVTNYNNTLNRSNLSNNTSIKEVKISTKHNTSMNNYQTKTYNLNKSYNTNINRSYQYIINPRTINTLKPHQIDYNTNTSYSNCISERRSFPITYSNKVITTKEERKSHFSPYRKPESYRHSYYSNVNKSYDNINIRTNTEKSRIRAIDENLNNQFFETTDNNREERERKISPQFGTLKPNNKTLQSHRNIYDNNKIVSIVDKKKKISNLDNNILNKINTTIDTSNIRTEKISNNYEKTTHINKYSKNNIKRAFSPISTHKREKSSMSSRRYKTYTEFHNHNNYNTIDNQLSVSIVKLPDENDKLNKTFDETPQIIKLKEKIIIQKEMPPETAEEGVGFQIFDMEISKRVSLFIEPSTELRQKITDESKELEVFRKREREKNNEIDKYKQDIKKEKLINLYKSLKRAIRIVESFKKRILYKKFYQYKKKCFIKSFKLEIASLDDWEITHKTKGKRDMSVQINQQSPVKTEKVVKNFKILKISKNFPVSYIHKKVEKPQKITRTKLNIISKSKKKDQEQQSDSWNTEITPLNYNTINILQTSKKRITNNSIDKTKTLEIIKTKPEMVDDEAQHEQQKNLIEGISLEIKTINKTFRNASSQYHNVKPKISYQKNFSIINKKKEKKILTRDAQCNTNILKTEEIGINAVEKVEQKPKNIEVKISTVKRSLTKFENPLLKKIWLKKAFKTFKENCKRPPYHLIIKKELLRMYFLKWRFVNGYGPDRYGNAYDRNGNLLYKIKGKVADLEIQNDEIIEKDDQGTQYTPMENVISYLKDIEIGPSYKKYVKKEMKDQSVGNNLKIGEKIQKRESISINSTKKRVKNKITKNNFVIIKNAKELKDSQTQSIQVDNKIDKLDNFIVIDDEFSIKKKRLRLKELITQMIYKREINDKLNLSEALRNWLKQTIIIKHKEEIEYENLRRREAKVKKNTRFSLIETKEKQEMGTQVIKPKNKIETTLNINLIKNIKKKNAETSVNFPNEFDLGKIKPKNENKILFESTKKPVILKTHKENDMNIYSADYIFREEVKKGIHHEMSETAKKRVYEILYKFFMSRGEPLSLLRKYFAIWVRKVKYMILLDNARIISEFCKDHLISLFNTRKWQKLGKRLLLKERIQLTKASKDITIRINKIFDLIRTTRINTVFSKKRYLHYIIIAWLAYTRHIKNKRSHVKNMYENMISTYMNLADDVFGNNQKNNPSVQDALFEAVDSDKFQTKDLQDVPIAKEYYTKKKNFSQITQNIVYHGDNSEYDKEIEKKYMDFKNILNQTNNKYNYLNRYRYKKYKNYNIYDEIKKGNIKVEKNENKEKKEEKKEFKMGDFMKKYKTNSRENKYEEKQSNIIDEEKVTFKSRKEEKEIPINKSKEVEKRTYRFEKEEKIESSNRAPTFGKKREGKEQESLENKGKGIKKTYRFEKEEIIESNDRIPSFGKKKEEKKQERPEMKEKEKERGIGIGKFKYEREDESEDKYTTSENKRENKETQEVKKKEIGKRLFRFQREERNEFKEKTITSENQREEQESPDIKRKEFGKRTFRYLREQKNELNHKNSILKNRKEEQESPDIKRKEKLKRKVTFENDEDSESKGKIRNTIKSEKTQKYESKENDSGSTYKTRTIEISNNNNNNNNKIFEKKSIRIEKDTSGETKNITIIKTINKSEIIESRNLVNDNGYNIEEKTPEKREKRNPSYSERRKLFKRKYESNKKENE